jgi:hypothetical protein
MSLSVTWVAFKQKGINKKIHPRVCGPGMTAHGSLDPDKQEFLILTHVFLAIPAICLLSKHLRNVSYC